MSITILPQDYQILFLDMNSFFASVEQQVRPELRGRPVGVAPYVGDSGCIIAASYEAKAMGVKIARVGEAKRLCPQISIVESRPALYMIYHKEIKKVIERFSPYYQPLSIDEFAVRLTPSEQNRDSAMRLALKMKAVIKNEVGDYLKCSIGIGPNVFLAKMAGERHKPDGLTAVTLLELRKFYSELPHLRKLVGINFRLEEHLKKFGIHSPLDLYNLEVGELQRILKHAGRLWYFRLRGYEVDDFVVKNKTIGHSHVLAPCLRTKEGALSVLEKLMFKVGSRLRREGYSARGVYVAVNFIDRGNFREGRKVATFSDQTSLRQAVRALLLNCRWQSRPLYVAVSTFDLVRQRSRQISMFPEAERSMSLSLAMDKINDRFGAGCLYPASMEAGKDSAPDRIPFGQPRYDIRH